MPLADERQLVLQAQDGDAEAFGRIYDGYVERIYRFVFFRVDDQQTAEDITSQVFLKAWSNLDRFEFSRTPYIAWLYTIAHNLLVDHWRKKGLTLVQLEDDAPLAAPDNPARQAEARESLARLSRAIEALPAAQREAFLLHEEAGLSVAQIAAVTGAGEEAAKSRLRYAMAKLKAAVDDD